MSNPNLSPHQHNFSTQGRRASYSKTSSATCPNAKASEDWRGIEDPGERRRMQNRIAQRNYREKQKRLLQRATELENSASPASTTDGLLGEPQLSPEIRDRRWSTGQGISSDFALQPQMPVYPESYSGQYTHMPVNHSSAVNEAYLKQPMTATSASYSYPGYNQPVAISYTGYSPTASYTAFAARSAPYSSPMYQRQDAFDGSPVTSTSGASITPVTPTSQGDGYPTHDAPLYGMDYTQTYNNSQVSANQAYTYPPSSVNRSDFFRQNYPSS